MTIPFIRYYPNGKTSPESIQRSPSVERMATRFMRNGGTYLITIHPTGEVELVAAVAGMVGQVERYAGATCHNDPVLPQAIDELVRDSIKEMERRQLVN